MRSAVRLYFPGLIAGAGRGGHPKAILRQVTEGGLSATLPLAPLESEHDDLALAYVTIPRPGLKPYLEWQGKNLRQVSFQAVIVNGERLGDSCEEQLDVLARMASADIDVEFLNYGRLVSEGEADRPARWRITDMSVRVMTRKFGTNEATRAEMRVTLSEASSVPLLGIPGMGRIVIGGGGGGSGAGQNGDGGRDDEYDPTAVDTANGISNRTTQVNEPVKSVFGRVGSPSIRGAGNVSAAGGVIGGYANLIGGWWGPLPASTRLGGDRSIELGWGVPTPTSVGGDRSIELGERDG